MGENYSAALDEAAATIARLERERDEAREEAEANAKSGANALIAAERWKAQHSAAVALLREWMVTGDPEALEGPTASLLATVDGATSPPPAESGGGSNLMDLVPDPPFCAGLTAPGPCARAPLHEGSCMSPYEVTLERDVARLHRERDVALARATAAEGLVADAWPRPRVTADEDGLSLEWIFGAQGAPDSWRVLLMCDEGGVSLSHHTMTTSALYGEDWPATLEKLLAEGMRQRALRGKEPG